MQPKYLSNYYETGPANEKEFHRKHKKKSDEESKKSTLFNDGVENMPKYFCPWNLKSRNFKICNEPELPYISATSVTSSTHIYYYYLNCLHSKFDSLYYKRYKTSYCFADFNI